MANLPYRGKTMENSIEAWKRLYGLAEQAMLKDKAEIERLKQRINTLEQSHERIT